MKKSLQWLYIGFSRARRLYAKNSLRDYGQESKNEEGLMDSLQQRLLVTQMRKASLHINKLTLSIGLV
jgi:hypothetical protein